MDQIHGAGFLAHKALGALKTAILFGPKDGTLVDYIRQISERLVCLRPAMASISNAVDMFSKAWKSASKAEALKLLDRIADQMKTASYRTAVRAASFIPQGKLATCSYSQTVIDAVRLAAKSGKRISAVILESRFGEISYGKKTALALKNSSVPLKIIPDSQVFAAARLADYVLVGADRVLPDGSVVNGFPSGKLAQELKEKIPFYVVCDSFKFSRNRKPVGEPGLELIPANLITAIITEFGIIPPDKIKSRMP